MLKREWCLLLLAAAALRAEPSAQPASAVPMNRISGALLSLDPDARVIRVTTEEGVNVEFAYTPKTAITDHGRSLIIDDLEYGDRVVVGYTGRDLTANAIDRLERAHRSLPAPSPETAGPDATSNPLSSGSVVPASNPTN